MKQNPPGFLSGYSRGEDVRDLFELTTSNMRLSEMWANQMMFYPAWPHGDLRIVSLFGGGKRESLGGTRKILRQPDLLPLAFPH